MMLSLVRSHLLGGGGFTPYTTPAPVAPVAPRLGRAFAEASSGDLDLDALEGATVAFVARLKADELPPERVIVALKAALVKYGGLQMHPSGPRDEANYVDGVHSALYDRVFTWVVDAYFDPRV